MAIIIPSKKTYERQNPKVRDNVIERIEVMAKEVVPDNEYETPVHNETIESGIEFYNSTISDNLFSQVDITGYAKEFWYAYHWISPQYIKHLSIKIPKIKNNKWTNKIYTGVKEEKENKSEEIPYIGVTIRATKETGTATGTYPLSGKPTTNYTKTEDYTGSINPKKTYTYTHTISGSLASKTVITPEKWVNEDNINTANYTDDNDYYYLNLTILCGYEEIGVGGYKLYGDPYMQTPTNISLSGECEKYTAYRVEITIYGNTIGIDLTDNTVYIPETDKTSKKVQSIDGNELMQTSNFWAETGENAIKRAFFATQQEYANGKETATLRCSIGEYYGDKEFSVRFGGELSSNEDMALYELFVSGDQKLAEGDIVYFKNHAVEISEIDEDYYVVLGRKDILSMYAGQSVVAKQLKISTKEKGVPMLFSEYDQVIPMKLGADGKDHPMSVYRDGTPKVFNVLSVHPYFDGAVWQELELQEIMKKV